MNDVTRWVVLLIATSTAIGARPSAADYQVKGQPGARSEAVVAPTPSTIQRGADLPTGQVRLAPPTLGGGEMLSLAPHLPPAGPVDPVEAAIVRAGAVEPARPAGEVVAAAPTKTELTEGPADPGLDVISSEWVMVGVKRPTGKKRRPVYYVDLPPETVYIVIMTTAFVGVTTYLVRRADRAGRSGRSGRPDPRGRRGKGRSRGRGAVPAFPLVILGSGRSIRRLTFSGQ